MKTQRRTSACTERAALISELRLTVPELMYLFFLSFFLAFTTWCGEEKHDDNVNVRHYSSSFFISLWANNKNIVVRLLHVPEGNGAWGMNPITAVSENKITLIMPCWEIEIFRGGAEEGRGRIFYEHKHCAVNDQKKKKWAQQKTYLGRSYYI